MTQSRKALFNAVRPMLGGRGFSHAEVAALNAVLDGYGVPPSAEITDAGQLPRGAALATVKEPGWVVEACKHLGTREIPGPSHNGWIAKGWARLGAAWFNDDETPWCGFFVAHCIDAAGLPYPAKGQFARARAWLDWGKSCRPVLGAIVVFARAGGGHVGFLVGESATNFYVLGGNQANAVTIAPIAKSRALGFRWPASAPLANAAPLPKMNGGAVSSDEA